ncbi:bifunctional 4-hydroxy-2-oxoglutarate aldolase/2-dehydro-3-deoxy-phosphogluconate aldolase [Jiella sp. MQZ9-1]|uniref:2-dehydro-3-deoxy-phosphogluconate aldolase n=1 Tax=Jiella flava TaxID=2816857 RepID=A0A939FW86_9HYPH|nr:bifunctional 4-hydroxy-2-oxoglutarate aldolase/2-dehydro-3-deoxy-phosphogluconate aldolase [Jiella flava]MBO0662610.1 bifunctional 4-hydroxy-2-oxoglutarate aldolase/2-dehydro-3-deoxy-phosphogluconate aldolase [Jiella flava]MCD2471032.1 bifunctional 4-hydroxy-2-oxoglutarate aldolase/2-dehydro-3-deoxy-phosphogluconate aldolase [Jiella flava]
MSQDTKRLLAILTAQPVVPVVAVDSAAQGVLLARALIAGGIGSIEVTLRTPAGLEAIAAIAAEVPEMVCGAGTILTPKQFEQAEKAGAEFIVSPGATVEILDAARNSDVPLLPGSATPSEMMAMLQEGYEVLKFFPAEQVGGAALLKSIAPVIPQIKFCPTGGISMKNVGDYLKLPNVLCVGGSWLAPKDKVAAGDWDAISALAAEASGLRDAA